MSRASDCEQRARRRACLPGFLWHPRRFNNDRAWDIEQHKMADRAFVTVNYPGKSGMKKNSPKVLSASQQEDVSCLPTLGS